MTNLATVAAMANVAPKMSISQCQFTAIRDSTPIGDVSLHLQNLSGDGTIATLSGGVNVLEEITSRLSNVSLVVP